MPDSSNLIIDCRSRVLGSLLGGALGDAWGREYEGTKPTFHFEIPARPTISDDTQLTLATCGAIVERGRVDPESIASHLLEWFRSGRVHGIGSSTLKAMRDLAVGTHWALAGARGEYSAGCGAAMRVAPLAFLLDPAKSEDRVVIRDVCRITHHNDEAYAGALGIVLAIRSVLSGEWQDRRSFLAIAFDGTPDSAVRDRIEALLRDGEAEVQKMRARGSTGHVVDVVPLALYCAQAIYKKPITAILAEAILFGGDTDTTASIAGQIAGCVVGTDGVPAKFLDDIENIQKVLQIAREFADVIVGKHR